MEEEEQQEQEEEQVEQKEEQKQEVPGSEMPTIFTTCRIVPLATGGAGGAGGAGGGGYLVLKCPQSLQHVVLFS